MKILALIPARGGSKRLPGKNIRLLGGKPLIAWTIEAARDSGMCESIYVSTDDKAIASVAREHGATVPGLRPANLATDTAGSVDVALHALELYERDHGSVDGLLLLQPTSPFRSAARIREAVDLYVEGKGLHPVVSMSPASSHPAWCFRVESTGIEPFLGWDMIGQRSQDLPPAWMLNGAIYLINPAQLKSEKKFFMPEAKALMMPNSEESIDIDTPQDWAYAEAMLAFSGNS